MSRHTRQARRPGAAVASVAALVVAIASPATAAWSTTGSAAGTGKATSLAAPTGGQAGSPTTTSLALSWTAPANSSAMTVSYTVTRDGGAAAAACTNISTTSCTDTFASSTTARTFTYAVTAKVGNWTATSGTFQGSPTTATPTVVNPTVSSPSASSQVTIARTSGTKTINVVGTGFVETPSVTITGNQVTNPAVTYNSATSVTITFTWGNTTGAQAGNRSFTLTNPDGGTVTCTGCINVT